jgi:tRNA-Thr(GGU) m(6)t(6)A37 methyltransferase TsaA
MREYREDNTSERYTAGRTSVFIYAEASVTARVVASRDGMGEPFETKEIKMDNVIYNPIGIIHSPYKEVKGMPIQPCGAKGVRGSVEIKHKYVRGLKDIDGFSHIILLYHFHISKGYSLDIVPFLDDHPKGVFATRAPRRPNPIGLSIVKLIKVEDGILHIEDVDILDNTPLLDIKPYVSEFDALDQTEAGWYSKAKYNVRSRKSDLRFKG